MATGLQEAIGQLGLEGLNWFAEQLIKHGLFPNRFAVDLPSAGNVLATVDLRFDFGEQVSVRFLADTSQHNVDFLVMRSSDHDQEGIVPDPDQHDYEECLGRLLSFKMLCDMGPDPNAINC